MVPAGLLLVGCIGGLELFFPDPSLSPALEEVYSKADQTSASEVGILGGQTVVLSGARLNGDQLSVYFGDSPAEIVTSNPDPSGNTVTVYTPPGPVGGGTVDVTLVHSGGRTTLENAYTYSLADGPVFDGEAGSLQLVGLSDGRISAGLGFWDELRPHQVGSMVADAALYYLPEATNESRAWDVQVPLPDVRRAASLKVAEQVLLTPLSSNVGVPFIWSRNELKGRYDLCTSVSGSAPTYLPETTYELNLVGGILVEPVTVQLETPPQVTYQGGLPAGLSVDSNGVSTVNLINDLYLDFDSDVNAPSTASYLLAELVVEAPDASLPGASYALERLVVRGDELSDVTGNGLFLFDRTQLGELPAVNTSCGKLAREVVSARLADSEDIDLIEDQYLQAGCGSDTLEDPIAAYPNLASVRLSRHYIYRVPLPAGAAGCSVAGECSGSNYFLVDLVSETEVPVNLEELPLSACSNAIDDDGDGQIDRADVGCEGDLDDDEHDNTGVYYCDDGIDNDKDGSIDFLADGSGDPGCTGPDDTFEIGEIACDDARDNDGDGLTDYRPDNSTADPGCSSSSDDAEISEDHICDDGRDNDGDGYRDYTVPGTTSPGDPGCSSIYDTTEKDETGKYICDNGIDDEGDALIDTADPGCRTSNLPDPYQYDEFTPDVACDDGIDNDDDGGIDFRVFGWQGEIPGDDKCTSATDISERN
jgi:hypothetical protein